MEKTTIFCTLCNDEFRQVLLKLDGPWGVLILALTSRTLYKRIREHFSDLLESSTHFQEAPMTLLHWAAMCGTPTPAFIQMVTNTIKEMAPDHERSRSLAYQMVIHFIKRNHPLERIQTIYKHFSLPVFARLNRFEGTVVLRETGTSGNLDLVKWMYNTAIPRTGNIRKDALTLLAEGAAISGHLHVMEWICETAAPNGFFSWFTTSSNDWADAAYYCAAYSGQLEIVRWLFEHQISWRDIHIHTAVMHGHTELVHYMYTRNRCNVTVEAMLLDACNSNKFYIMLPWLRDELNNSAVSSWPTMKRAMMLQMIERGKIEALRWLIREGQMTWQEEDLMEAIGMVAFTHIAAVDALIVEGCPWNNETVACVLRSKHPRHWLRLLRQHYESCTSSDLSDLLQLIDLYLKLIPA